MERLLKIGRNRSKFSGLEPKKMKPHSPESRLKQKGRESYARKFTKFQNHHRSNETVWFMSDQPPRADD